MHEETWWRMSRAADRILGSDSSDPVEPVQADEDHAGRMKEALTTGLVCKEHILAPYAPSTEGPEPGQTCSRCQSLTFARRAKR